ncbi:hypothetical protein AAA799E16_01319 [Marine Group I thaumarchaeote SCGC AAA799-E16]|uniref:Uncharacterized protein n=5 Tax=Marine Group I TaxID=905826 RepID=A0A087S653_9ARCH|nr:hypothetical protein AAA799N04_01066 [Marine Group I thaumarchaeote SCGC AAA799-N04]KER05967.1 hypothetical protein AAA799E16_01319 [Marine Group I thaumarchaeote SCGC AAA799-E16]KFM16634.1 hypothetical protein AAA799D11_00577 [Marine Group I thaumarchaeote SCGC AAA799-D11]KFM18687.1 hypothetical protein SCCGRSA3_01020 [Marine Group I thaumarchaeote SCGC RSA3]KFM21207.1 hypothetical protein AAA799B03_01262 [Marine Group I thaumarchaeote SCGC AAA799-B03]
MIKLVRRVTVTLDDELIKKIYNIQAKEITKSQKHISFSNVINLQLKRALR